MVYFLFSEANITLIVKQGKNIRKNYTPISLMNVDVKILNKMLSNRIQCCVKGIMQHNQVGFISGMLS